MSDIKESKFRLIVAWVSWWLILSSGAVLALSISAFLVFYYQGGLEFIKQIWNGTDGKSENSSSFLLPLIYIAVPIGGKIGIWLWGKFARKIKLVSDEKISKMGG